RRKVVVLHRLDGIRKTQLAIRFARVHKSKFTAIFWLNGKDREMLIHSLAAMSQRLPPAYRLASLVKVVKDSGELKRRATRVLQWPKIKGNSRWLLLFDNVDK
ncbi:hypothetical protein K469DRAFT_463480, partial [Zopfia rhizophila CBS 207.26]